MLCISTFSTFVSAADIHIYAGDSFENAAENLNPGDTLIVHEGTYNGSGRISIQVQATALAPAIIRAAAGEQRPLITRVSGDAVQNTINIEDADYLTIQGLEISSNGGDGVTVNGSPSYITLEDLLIHDISVGLNFRSSMHHLTIRGNHIYNTNDTGEGMYVGCNNAACAVTDSVIENNWIHNTFAASQGDGIEIKLGSHSNIIRNNVIHDTNYPCILLYGTTGNPRNVVEGNVMWNCGDSGIQAAADAVIRNNIILDGPGTGFNSQPHQSATPQNLEFVHNTLIGGSPCVRLNDWDGKTGLIFANNAVYCPTNHFVISGLSGVIVSGNVFEPSGGSFPGSGYITGRSENEDFTDVANRQVYPTHDSPLLGAGDPAYVTPVDFNGTTRTGNTDAGAYTWSGDPNPGWYIQANFKSSNPTPTPPTLDFSTNTTVVANNDSATLSWSTANADTCQASGSWTGTKGTSGSEDTGSLTADVSYDMSCTGAGGSVNKTVSITVQPQNPTPAPTPNPTPAPSGGSSSSALNPLWILFLVLTGHYRRRTSRTCRS